MATYMFVRIVEETFYLDVNTIEEARRAVESCQYESPDARELESKIVWKREKKIKNSEVK